MEKNSFALDISKLAGGSGGGGGGDVSSVNGKTGAVVLGKGDVGLGNVNNTSDANKPISTATQTALNNKENKTTEVTVSAAGAVTQALDAGKVYHFTGTLTGLTITLTAATAGQLAQYHFDFVSGATAPTLTMPQTVTMPDSFSVEANNRYEVDILNNYGAVMAWAVS